MYEKKLEWLRPRSLRPGMIIYWKNQPIGTVANNPYRTSSNGHWWDQINLKSGHALEYDSEDWVLVEIPPDHGEVFWANFTDVLAKRERGEMTDADARAEIERLKKEY
jgi:hypothetical protein